MSNRQVVYIGRKNNLSGREISSLTIDKTYHIIDKNNIAIKIRNDKGIVKFYFKDYFKNDEAMTTNNTHLPEAIEKRIDNLAKEAAKKEAQGRVPIFKMGYESGYASGLEEGVKLLYEVFQKHESGLLPDRFIYEKIKRFLYGE